MLNAQPQYVVCQEDDQCSEQTEPESERLLLLEQDYHPNDAEQDVQVYEIHVESAGYIVVHCGFSCSAGVGS
jgi:hypothetical protein